MNKEQLQTISYKYKLSNDDWARGTGYCKAYCSQVIHGQKPISRSFAHKCREYLDRVCIPYSEQAEAEKGRRVVQKPVVGDLFVDGYKPNEQPNITEQVMTLMKSVVNTFGETRFLLDLNILGHPCKIDIIVGGFEKEESDQNVSKKEYPWE